MDILQNFTPVCRVHNYKATQHFLPSVAVGLVSSIRSWRTSPKWPIFVWVGRWP